jgi:hypothetical protein
VRLRIGRFEAGNEISLLRPLIPAVVNGFVEEVRVLWLPLTWGIVREIQHFGRYSEGLRRFEQVECLCQPLRDRDGKKIVFLAFHGKAHMREVHVLSQRTDRFLVDGLVGGESAISKALEDLKDGDTIKVKE